MQIDCHKSAVVIDGEKLTPGRIAQVDLLWAVPLVEAAQKQRSQMVCASTRDGLNAASKCWG